MLADKAYPNLPEEAREQFAVNQYLSQVDNPQVAFSVKQAKPKSVNDAVRLTLEMVSYLQPNKPPTQVNDQDSDVVAAAAAPKPPQDKGLELLLERMERIELELKANKKSNQERSPGMRRGPSRCWNCQGVGHFSRDCREPRRDNRYQEPRRGPRSGNGQPSGQ